MDRKKVELLPYLNQEVVEDITGFKLCSYLVALEGWRRGLELKWYKDESKECKLDRLNSSTQGKFFSLSTKDKTHYFYRSRGDKVSNKAVRLVQNKERTKEYLKDAGVPVPLGDEFTDDKKLLEYAEEIGYPVVIKPRNGSMGKGVYTNIQSLEELKEALSELRSTYKGAVLIERYHPGKEYRVYVVGDHVVGATNRIPANIVGNGTHTVEELIEKKNEERRENPYLAKKPIKVDFEVKKMLENAGYELNSVPKEGERIFLREKSNLSSGGDPIEATDELTVEVKQVAVDTLKALPSIPHAGVDIIVDPEDARKCVVLEVNATAEIGFHLFPTEGKAKDVPAAIIDYYFPETKDNYRSYAYFDYHSVVEPLKMWSTEEIKIYSISPEPYFLKKYVVTGEVVKVGYMTFIKRRALRQDLFGYAQRVGDDIEVTVIGNNIKELDQFIDVVKKGSRKSKVEKVVPFEAEPIEEPFKLGFFILNKNHGKKSSKNRINASGRMRIRDIVGRKLDMTDTMIVREALSRGVEIEKLPNKKFKMSYGCKSYVIRKGRVADSYNSKLAQRCTDLKEVTSRLLRSKGFSAPENVVFKTTDLERAWNWAKPVLPIVLKPNHTIMGKLVFVNIDTYEEFVSCFNKIAEKYDEVLIEEFVEGKEYRFSYLNGEITAIAHRVPANVKGDGVSTINQLVNEKNKERNRKKNPRHKKLKIDDESLRVLRRQNFDLDSVPKEGQVVYLRENSNVSTGGDAIDVTDTIDDVIKKTIASAAATIPGLKVCGIDVIINEDGYYILEINSWSMLSMHHYPWEGKPRNVIGQLVEAMFPDLKEQN